MQSNFFDKFKPREQMSGALASYLQSALLFKHDHSLLSNEQRGGRSENTWFLFLRILNCQMAGISKRPCTRLGVLCGRGFGFFSLITSNILYITHYAFIPGKCHKCHIFFFFFWGENFILQLTLCYKLYLIYFTYFNFYSILNIVSKVIKHFSFFPLLI